MHQPRSLATILAVLWLALAWSSQATAQLGLIEKDKPFPTISFPTLDGTMASIEDFAGKKTLLINFASW